METLLHDGLHLHGLMLLHDHNTAPLRAHFSADASPPPHSNCPLTRRRPAGTPTRQRSLLGAHAFQREFCVLIGLKPMDVSRLSWTDAQQ